MIDRLWDERPPVTAAKTLQGYISHLRRALGAGVIVTVGRGYRLAVAAEQVDVGRFEALSADGRRALADCDGEASPGAAGCCTDVVAGGAAFADFTYEPFARDTIDRLQRERLGALEDRIEADLALGGAGSLSGSWSRWSLQARFRSGCGGS